MRELFRGRRSGIRALGGRVIPSLPARRRSALERWFREVCQLAFRVPEVEDEPRSSPEQIAANEQKWGLADDFDAGARSR
jgi:hypothetical protein